MSQPASLVPVTPVFIETWHLSPLQMFASFLPYAKRIHIIMVFLNFLRNFEILWKASVWFLVTTRWNLVVWIHVSIFNSFTC